MNKNQIAKKYSKALITSVDLADIPRVIAEIKAFSELIYSNKKIKLLFAGQIFSDEEKEKAFAAVAPALKFHAGSERFLKLIITQGHLPAAREIIAASSNAYNEMQKKAAAVVISPVKLDTTYSDRLKKALKKITEKDIDITNQVDPSLLGGFVVRVGSTIFDSSVKGQLRLLKAELMR